MSTPTPPHDAPSKGQSLDRLEEEFGVLLRRVRRAMAARASVTHPELTSVGYLILQRLSATGPRRSADLVVELDVDKAAVSRQVAHLLELGLVRRTADPDDGRAQLLDVSALGTARLQETHLARRKLLEHRLGGWSEADLADFVATLGRYNSSVEPSPED